MVSFQLYKSKAPDDTLASSSWMLEDQDGGSCEKRTMSSRETKDITSHQKFTARGLLLSPSL